MQRGLLLSVEDVNGITELIALIDFDQAPADEASQVAIGIRGGVKSSGRFFEVWDEFVGFVNIGDGATGGAWDAADLSLGPALVEHSTGIRIVGMDDDAVGNITSQLGIGMSGWVKNLGVYATDALLGISGLDGGIGVSSDADSTHREKAGRGLSMRGAEAAFSGPAAKSLANLMSLEGDDMHPLRGGIDDIEPFGVVIGVTGPALSIDEGINGGPVRVAEFGG